VGLYLRASLYVAMALSRSPFGAEHCPSRRKRRRTFGGESDGDLIGG